MFPFATIFCHGLDSGPIQAAKLKPKHISSVTGETITCSRGVDVLHGPITAPAMSEIIIRNTATDHWRTPSAITKQLFCKITALIALKGYGISVEQSKKPGI